MTKVRNVSVAAALLLATLSTHAHATCWSGTEHAAARVRNLQTRLMDATLRCQAAGIDVTIAYNGFVRAARETLRGANAVLLARMGQGDYDRFTTRLANTYGRGVTDQAVCAEIESAALEATERAADIEHLLAMEDRIAAEMDLPGGTCPITFAAALPVAADVTASLPR